MHEPLYINIYIYIEWFQDSYLGNNLVSALPALSHRNCSTALSIRHHQSASLRASPLLVTGGTYVSAGANRLGLCAVLFHPATHCVPLLVTLYAPFWPPSGSWPPAQHPLPIIRWDFGTSPLKHFFGGWGPKVTRPPSFLLGGGTVQCPSVSQWKSLIHVDFQVLNPPTRSVDLNFQSDLWISTSNQISGSQLSTRFSDLNLQALNLCRCLRRWYSVHKSFNERSQCM